MTHAQAPRQPGIAESPENGSEPAQTGLNVELVFAAVHAEVERVEALLSMGADARCMESAALGFAARSGNKACLLALLPHSDPAADGHGALRLAASSGRLECMATLLPYAEKASASERDRIVSAAAIGGRWACVEMLSQAWSLSDEALSAALEDVRAERDGAKHADMARQLEKWIGARQERRKLDESLGSASPGGAKSRSVAL